MKAVITGMRGYLAHLTAKELLNDGYEVIGLTRGAKPENPIRDVNYIQTDYTNIEQLKAVFVGVDAIIHLAGIAHKSARNLNQSDYDSAIVDTTAVLVEAAVDAKVSRFVFASTAKVYGEDLPNHRIDENTKIDPEGFYAISKAKAENALDRSHQLIETIVFRFPPIYGANSKGAVKYFIKSVKLGIPLFLKGFGAKRTFLFDENCAKLLSAAARGELSQRVYLPYDVTNSSVEDFYCKLWRAKKGSRPPLFGLFKVPKLILNMLSHSRFLSPLFSEFNAKSVHEHEFSKFLRFSAAEAMKRCFAAEKTVLLLVTVDWYFLSHRLPLAKALRQNGYRVIVGTANGPNVDKIKAEGFEHIAIPFSRRSMNPLRELSVIFSIAKAVYKFRPALVHSIALKPTMYGLIARLMAPRHAYIGTLTGLGYAFIAGGLKGKILRSIIRLAFLSSKVVGRQKIIFQNTDDLDLFVSKRLVEKSNTTCIPGSGVNVQKYHFTEEPIESRIKVVFPARMLVDKGLVEFVEAARLCKQGGLNAEFILSGSFDESNRASVEKAQLESWHNEGVVNWIGHQSDMYDVYSKAHIVVLPSYREGLPLALLEAAAVGRPIVTTDVPGCRDVVVNQKSGFLVPVKNAEAIFDSLKTLINSKDLRTKMGQSSRKHVEERFSVERVNELTLEAYSDLL